MIKYDLEERLIDFSVSLLRMTDKMPPTYAGTHLSKQLIRSGTSPALNYGEAQSSESRRDFIHKMKIALKELRETMVCLKIIKRGELYMANTIMPIIKENNELICIFVKSIETAKKNQANTV